MKALRIIAACIAVWTAICGIMALGGVMYLAMRGFGFLDFVTAGFVVGLVLLAIILSVIADESNADSTKEPPA